MNSGSFTQGLKMQNSRHDGTELPKQNTVSPLWVNSIEVLHYWYTSHYIDVSPLCENNIMCNDHCCCNLMSDMIRLNCWVLQDVLFDTWYCQSILLFYYIALFSILFSYTFLLKIFYRGIQLSWCCWCYWSCLSKRVKKIPVSFVCKIQIYLYTSLLTV